jgi:cell division protein FtsB
MGTEIPTPVRAVRFRRPRRLRRRTALLLITVGVVLLLAFNIGRQVIVSWTINQQEAALEAQVAQAEADNAALQRYLDYLNSDAYTDVAARQYRGVGNPGEQLLIIPPGAAVHPAAIGRNAPPADPPLLDQWLTLFFGH